MRSFLAFMATLGLIVLAALMWLAPVWNFADLFRQFWAPLTLAALLAALAVFLFGKGRQRWGAPLLAFLIAAPGLPETVVSLSDIPLTPPAGTPVTVVTHNLWGRNATPEAAVERIIETDADIVALQEAFGTAWVVPELLEEAYPNRADCDRYASVIVTRLPIVESGCLDWWWWRTRDGQTDTPFFHAPPASWATIRMDDGSEITVVSVHMTWPDPIRRQDEQREGLAYMVQAFAQDRLIVMGDFNAAAPSRALARFERDLDLRRITPGMATWPSESLWANRFGVVSPVPTMMTGIDHVFVGAEIIGWEVDRGPDTGSDHRPIRARIFFTPLLRGQATD
ncbi:MULTISPECIES: endonuclease/exonuclease/phosphatase family protein [Hyphobacterium]|uniref:Endonuclease/exonuclease/phosphatase family protein n=1 Tax=Hyphobacterium vulgare TaxID=1736751 RepID=A0ABV6ZUD1_9PROT